jgi:hypothetical protein
MVMKSGLDYRIWKEKADKLDGESGLWKKWISEKVLLNLMGVL